MKRKVLSVSAIGLSFVIAMSSMQTGTHTTLGNRTGSNGGSDGCNSCHGGSANNATTVNIILLQNGNPVTAYTPGQTYTVRLDASNTTNGRPKFGFQLTAANTSGTSVGTIAANGVTGVATRANSTLIEHTQPQDGTLSSESNYTYVRDFTWTAPAAGTGTVKFYAVLNAVNGNGNDDANGNDQWNKGTSASITEAGTSSIATAKEIAGISVYPNPGSSELNIKIENEATGSYDIVVNDLTGKTLMQEHHLYSGSGQVFKMDINQLAQGLYFVNIKQGEHQSVIKFHKR